MKLKCRFDSINMGEEIISVPVGNGAEEISKVVKLNEAGHEIMNLLEKDTTPDEIVDVLVSKYENDTESLYRYVNDVIKTLSNAGLIDE